tara:strand:+ start:881 stop:1753 length:873 start_codon:yes stop_codon:yes gene_type:complete
MTSIDKNYLVILAGSPRGGEKTWQSMYKNLLEPLNADLALCCSDKWDQNISLFEKADYKWTFKEFSNYEDYYKNNFKGNWQKYFETGKDTGLYSSGMVHFVFKDIIKKNYLNILKEYKYIVYTRFDQFYVDTHPRAIDGRILIPEGEDYHGICDRHALFPSEFSEEFLSICSFIDSDVALQNIKTFNNCETTFLQQLENNGLIKNVKRYKRIQFTSSLRGEHTNWRVAKYKLHLYKKLMIKYPEEFITSIKNSIDKHDFYNYFLKEPLLTANYIYLKTRRLLGKLKITLL